MIKLICGSCGYTIRTSAKWIEVGLPVCCCGELFNLAQKPKTEDTTAKNTPLAGSVDAPDEVIHSQTPGKNEVN
jgi:hypothetical protein